MKRVVGTIGHVSHGRSELAAHITAALKAAPKDRPTVDGPLTAEELEDRDAGWDRQFKLSEGFPLTDAYMKEGVRQIAQLSKAVFFNELDKLPRHMGVDFGSGDSWHVVEYTRDAEGNLQVRHISEAEFHGGRVEDCGNQYTGGQDF